MKKNNKGFFLAETIVVIALVTTVMAFVYPNISKLNENYNNRTKYYDQTEDLFALKAYYEMNKDGINELTRGTSLGCSSDELGGKQFTQKEQTKINAPSGMNIEKIYITGYMTNNSDANYNFNKYLKRLKKTTNDVSAYRLIGVFKNNDETHYASIKIDNPNPNRTCNLGG